MILVVDDDKKHTALAMVHNDPKGYHFRQGLATYFTKTLNLG